jgi:topoisomerase-4 subunit B
LSDLFNTSSSASDYGADQIEVLEGLEPVRRRPGMYIGGTDDTALHHLASEILDNAMDEAVAGQASLIEMSLKPGNLLTVVDNGRGIPVDPHPKFPKKSALEVILTTLHSGGKFSGKAYATSGGLHGVGSSVVNALSSHFAAEVARERVLWRQEYVRGVPTGKLKQVGAAPNRRGTSIAFVPDTEIFADRQFSPARLFKLCRSKAYLFRGVKIRWSCDAALLKGDAETPAAAELHFPGGLRDSLAAELGDISQVLPDIWAGEAKLPVLNGLDQGKLEWAAAWVESVEASLDTYCNTVPTPQGGTHEAGFRAALLKGLRAWAETRANKRGAAIIGEDVTGCLRAKVSLFIREPQFQGQTKERLTNPEAGRLTETSLRDRFDHFLAGNPAQADNLLTYIIERAEERIARRDAKNTPRKTATRRLRLPGKLSDCAIESAEGTEIFLVEGDSAGGSAKQARNRNTQAILPLKGKILNVASATVEKLRQNQELRDLIEALGCGVGSHFNKAALRYERVIIMTDADVDGAHIASLLMTFFYRELPELIRGGQVYLAQPPLYRITQGAKTTYAMDDAARERIVKNAKQGQKLEISRFKGLGEMPPAVLKETTMDPAKRTLLRICAPADTRAKTSTMVESLMGKRPELRFQFIQENAGSVSDLDI